MPKEIVQRFDGKVIAITGYEGPLVFDVNFCSFNKYTTQKNTHATQLISSVRMPKAKRLPCHVMNSITTITVAGCTGKQCDMPVTTPLT